jgi:uncharacterized protein (DUF1501 family)
MMMKNNQTRRAFLQSNAKLGLAGVAAPFVTTLACIGEAAAQESSGYKAIVCIFLAGGNDQDNTVTPYDMDSYNSYAKLRPQLAYARDDLTATLLKPNTNTSFRPHTSLNGRQYALAPAMAPLLPLFQKEKLAVLLNVGTLVRPTTTVQLKERGFPLPPQLGSHNDQQSYWQSSSPEGAVSGWGGRIGDLMQSGNGNSTLTCINTSGNAAFLTGKTTLSYSVGAKGPIPLIPNNDLFGSMHGNNGLPALKALKALMSGSRANIFENEHAKVCKRALETGELLYSQLQKAPAVMTTYPGTKDNPNPLADQLKTVARMISINSALGAKRQVFFVQMGGFDLHSYLVETQPILLDRVASAMRAFYDHTVQLGVADKVTTFTSSDFGRPTLCNNDGSDHGWGGIHFVMGGAVKGGQFYGEAPVIALKGPNDAGQGSLLPTTSVDQYAATLATWLGVSNSDMSTVLPNIGNYNQSTWNLGFV